MPACSHCKCDVAFGIKISTIYTFCTLECMGKILTFEDILRIYKLKKI